MNKKLQPATRIITLLSAIALAAVLFLPMWKIELTAPQYPEGLKLIIYPHKLGGDVEIINGLNHYIGMRTLHADDFVEFQILPYLIGAIAFFGLLSFVINRKWFFTAWAGFFILFGIVAMVDFYRWEYNYGHSLDPTAPIKVPGMSYQPPLIGYKELLNFGAYSIPDAGGWIFIAVGLLMVVGLILELRKTVRITRKLEIKAAAAGAVMLMTLSSCSVGPEPLKLGVDACDYCKMTISDARFGGELITTKGRLYKFDDVHCLDNFLTENKYLQADIKSSWLIDFSGQGSLIEAQKALLLKSDKLKSPMGGNMAAFASREQLNAARNDYPGEVLTWKNPTK
jgi:copper chaperone NosL